MKILFAAVFSSGSTNISQAAGFEHCGAKVVRYDYRLRKAQLGSAAERDCELRDKAQDCDLVVLSKCECVSSSVLKHIQGTGVPVFLWYMDPMHNFTGPLQEKIQVCHRTFCALTVPHRKAKELVGDRALLLQEGFDPRVDKPVATGFKSDVTFIGHLRGNRRQYSTQVNFRVVSGAYGQDHARVVSESRINLNFTQGGTSDRTYKVLAAGGFLLTEPWPDMEKDFTPGRDLDTFQGSKELGRKIRYWLDHPRRRKRIAACGRQTVQKFSRNNWAARILEVADEQC
jgi:spore maturation protein CgeB